MDITGLTRRVVVREQSDVGEARGQAIRAAESARFDELHQSRLTIIAAELATNLLKHTARGGEILINILAPPAGPGSVELLAIDRGPGIANQAWALRDNYSSSGTLGIGLGAIQRQSSQFDFHSTEGGGTAVLSRVYADHHPTRDGGFQVGVITVPKDGEEVSGDTWAACRIPAGLQVLLVDGLGHGLLASEAARVAAEAFQRIPGRTPTEVLRTLHRPLSATRGATVGVATIDSGSGVVTYGGVGNVAAAVFTPGSTRRLISINGTLGREPVTYHEFRAEWNPGATLIMHSDGLMSQWRLDYLPGLATRDPSLIAAVLFRDFARDFDDVTVLVARESPTGGAS